MMRCARGGTRGGEFFLLFGVANGAMKNREIGGAPVLNGHHLTGTHNNQPIDGVGGGDGVLEMR